MWKLKDVKPSLKTEQHMTEVNDLQHSTPKAKQFLHTENTGALPQVLLLKEIDGGEYK